MTEEAKHGLRAHRRAAAGAGGHRRRAHQGPRRTTGSAAASAADPSAALRVWARSPCSKADELVRAHVADPAAQSATVDRFLDDLDADGVRRGVHRDRRDGAACVRPAATHWPTVVSEFDTVAGRLRRARPDHACRRTGRGGQAARSRSRRSTSISPTPPTTRRPRCGWSRRLLSRQGRRPHAWISFNTAVSQRWSERGQPGRRHRARRAAGAAEAGRGRRRGRRGRGAAVPVRPRPR